MTTSANSMAHSTTQSDPHTVTEQHVRGPNTLAVDRAHFAPAPDLEIGRVLIDEGIVTADEIVQSLPTAQGPQSFLKLLPHCPMVSDQEIAALLAARHRVPTLDLDRIEVPRAVVEMIPAKVAYELECIPLARVGHVLCIGTSNIRDRGRLLRLRAALGGGRVKLFPCDPQQLRRHIVRYYFLPREAEGPGAVPEEVGPQIEAPLTPQAREEADSPQPEAAAVLPNPFDEGDSDLDPERPSEPTVLDDRDESGPEFSAEPTVTEERDEISPESSPNDLFAELGKALAEQSETNNVVDFPGAESPLQASSSPLDESQEADLTADELEDLFSSMDGLDEEGSGLQYFHAEPVPDEEVPAGKSGGDDHSARAWEQVHFTHAPINAEPAVLGFPGADPFDEIGDAAIGLPN